MKAILCLSIFLLALSIAVGRAQEKPVVLLIARGEAVPGGPGALKVAIDKEARPIINRLNELGYAVDVASESGKPIEALGSKLIVNMKLADVQTENYVGVIIPCMGQTPGAIPQEAVKIVQDVFGRNMPVAAQQSGVVILGAAGLLKGRNYAIGRGWETLVARLQGGIFKGVGVVQDGNIVTSGTCPLVAEASEGQLKDGTDELVTTFATMLER